MPLFPLMHEITPWAAHEEIHLLAIDFSTMFFETLAYVPDWATYYRAHDQTPHYRYMRTVLQALQHLTGDQRWVLKSPQHIEQFGPLLEVFPDATFVVTHRDPVNIVTSMATMVAYTARMNVDTVEPAVLGNYWADRIEVMLRACVRDRDLLPADQTIDVRFDEFMADDLAMVRRIYELAEPTIRRSGRDRPWPSIWRPTSGATSAASTIEPTRSASTRPSSAPASRSTSNGSCNRMTVRTDAYEVSWSPPQVRLSRPRAGAVVIRRLPVDHDPDHRLGGDGADGISARRRSLASSTKDQPRHHRSRSRSIRTAMSRWLRACSTSPCSATPRSPVSSSATGWSNIPNGRPS